MRVLVIAGTFAPNRIGGPAVVAERVCAGLRDAGHDVVVLTGAPDRTVRYQVAGVPVVGVPNADAARVAEDLLTVLQPDLVHQHSPRELGTAPLQVAQQRGIPTVVSVYGAEPQLPPDLLAGAAAVVVDTPDQASGAKVHVVPNGAPPPPPQWRRPPHHGPLRFGYIGGTDPDQGYQQLVAALGRSGPLRRTDYELHVVDRATLRGVRSLREWHFQVPGLLRLVPGVDLAGLAAFYGSIDVLLSLPQSPGHIGLSVREAMLHGVWPIATDIPANAAVVAPGMSGDLVAVDDAADLAGAVDRVLEQPPGPFDAAAVPTLVQQVQQLAAIYTETAG